MKMIKLLFLILILVSISILIDAGVKIEITRVKEQPKSMTMPSMDEKTHSNNVEDVDAMTTTTTESTLTPNTTLSPNSTDFHLTSVLNSTDIPSAEITTISPNNSIETNKTMQTNLSKNESLVPTLNTTTAIAISKTELHPLLSEYSRRQMRRKLIPPDYYCPCDLKVPKHSIDFNVKNNLCFFLNIHTCVRSIFVTSIVAAMLIVHQEK